MNNPDVETSLSTARGFEIHLEPGRSSALRLFLMQNDVRVSSVSGLVPKRLRELLQSQDHSPSPERELMHFLSEPGCDYPVHVHTRRGVVVTRWDPSAALCSKTELDLVGQRVRVQRVVADKNDPATVLHDFVRIGEGLIADLEQQRLLRLSDTSGWYVARQLEEKPARVLLTPENELEYETEDPGDVSDADNEFFSSVSRPPSPLQEVSEGFAVTSEPFEVSTGFLSDKKISFSKEQRAGYLKDLVLKVGSQTTLPAEGALVFRVTMAKTKTPTRMLLKAACLWDGQWFDLGDNFSKYFEHLHSMRTPVLRKIKYKKALSEAAFALLGQKTEPEAELLIQARMAKMGPLDLEAAWEAAEYLRRFFKTFVSHQSEVLVAASAQWSLIGMDFSRWGALLGQVQDRFGGDLFDWLKSQQKEVEVSELFSRLRVLYSQLKENKIELCFNQKSVQNARFRVKVRAEQKADHGWFEMHPEIFWEGQPIGDTEWRRILENQGILEQAEGLWVLDETSLRTLELLKDLLHRPARRGVKDVSGIARVPRTQILDWVWLRREGVEMELSAENERLVQSLMNFERIESRAVPDRFCGSLRDYQKDGYNWISFLYEHRLGGCLADDMGLGKTVQAIAFLGGLKEKKVANLWKSHDRAPHLVVVPATLVFNWKQEFHRFYPDMKVYEYNGSARHRDFEGAEVVLTTYDLLRQESAFFREKRFHVLIFDEAQFLKNIFAQRTSTARELKADFTLTLTGTPLENHIGEYYSILDLSLPGLLGKYEEFRHLERSGHWERLKKRAAPFVLRRTKDKALKELPPKSESEIYLNMAPRQKALYHKVVSQVRRRVQEVFQKQAAPQASLTALTAILRLRQVCVSPQLVDPKADERSPKMEHLLAKLQELISEDHSAIVFSQFTSFLDVLENELKKEKLEYSRMDGRTPTAKRKALIDAFQCGASAPIFLVSLKTGGVGLNLTRASYVFHLDPWWNPAVENQASDRVHRIGQKKNVFVTRLLMRHTVEEKMVLLKKKKTALYRQVLEGAVSSSGRPGILTKEDFDFLLT